MTRSKHGHLHNKETLILRVPKGLLGQLDDVAIAWTERDPNTIYTRSDVVRSVLANAVDRELHPEMFRDE